MYIALSVTLKRPSFLAVFFLCESLILCELFYSFYEYELYSIEFILWSYIFTGLTRVKNKVFCAIICLLSAFCCYDSYTYEALNSEEYQEIVYICLEYLIVCAHFLFIISFVEIKRVRGSFRRFFDSIRNIPLISDCFIIIDYNKSILTKVFKP